MSRTYSRMTCWVCKKDLSTNGLARVNHLRRHVREGKLVERKDSDGYICFETPKRNDKAEAPDADAENREE